VPEAGTAGSGDYYARRVSSPAYRASRIAKAEVVARLLGSRLDAAERIADVGTGTGIIKKELERRTSKFIVGFELDIPFVVEKSGVVAADGCRLPVPDASFDLVLLNHIYEHVPDPGRLFREAWRVLRPGGAAYVSAGSRFAVIEPHYRLPFLSWLPRRAADLYLRASGRGGTYEGVRFLAYRPLVRLMRAPGFEVRDITQTALRELLGPDRGGRWRLVWAVLRRMPRRVRREILTRGSPQWFFILEKPDRT
jgi:SAM-dependent methyltransferase